MARLWRYAACRRAMLLPSRFSSLALRRVLYAHCRASRYAAAMPDLFTRHERALPIVTLRGVDLLPYRRCCRVIIAMRTC